MLCDLEHNYKALFDRGHNSDSHLWGGVPVVGADRAALMLTAAAGGLVAHQLVNYPGRDASVL